jgi:hypothetical protein
MIMLLRSLCQTDASKTVEPGNCSRFPPVTRCLSTRKGHEAAMRTRRPWLGRFASALAGAAVFEPFEDALPVLHEIGYKAGKAKLLAAYAHDVPTAIHGAILFGWEAIPDCTYTSFGADILDNTKSAGYVLAAVILAGT